MTDLDREVRRLVVEAAIAAPNYGLIDHAKVLLGTFGALDLNAEVKALAKAMVYFGLFRPRAALTALKNQTGKKVDALRTAIFDYQKGVEQEKQRRN